MCVYVNEHFGLNAVTVCMCVCGCMHIYCLW